MLRNGLPSVLIGFNPQPMNAFSGPGYFTATKGTGDHEGELVVDYTKIPTEKPANWPPLRGPRTTAMCRRSTY